jgi:hypothetical protein
MEQLKNNPDSHLDPPHFTERKQAARSPLFLPGDSSEEEEVDELSKHASYSTRRVNKFALFLQTPHPHPLHPRRGRVILG